MRARTEQQGLACTALMYRTRYFELTKRKLTRCATGLRHAAGQGLAAQGRK